MRLFKGSYQDKAAGKRVEARGWSLDFADHTETRRRWPLGMTDRRACKAVGDNVERLVSLKLAGLAPDRELTLWLENCPADLRERLAGVGLISGERAAAGKPILEHLEEYREYLLHEGQTAEYARLSFVRLQRIIEGCGMVALSDLKAERVRTWLQEHRKVNLKDDKQKIRLSAETYNHYVKHAKSFCNWLVKWGRLSDNPLRRLSPLEAHIVKGEGRERRALKVDEFRKLLAQTAREPGRWGMTGAERALLYRLAAETGLRSNELRGLKVKAFDLKACTVMVEWRNAKNRREAVLPIRPDMAEELRGLLANKLPEAAVFTMPKDFEVVKMLRDDLEAAEIPYYDASGRKFDFHALRHTTGSMLAAAGVHPKVAQSLMRHSTMELTMKRYTHVFKGQESAAVESLPDLGAPPAENTLMLMTGTDNLSTENPEITPAKTPAKLSGKQKIQANSGELKTALAVAKGAFLMKEVGFEPTTHGLKGRCSTS